MKKILLGGAVAAGSLLAFSLVALAAPSVHTNFGKTLNASTCNTSGAPIVNVSLKVINDSDSGFGGNAWANDDYVKTIQVWPQADGTNCAIVKYEGQFVTYDGLSPSGNSTVAAGVRGAFEGGYQATFDGTLTPTLPTHGNLGTYDYACDGTFTCNTFDWVSAYFTGNTFFNQPYWAWDYHAGHNGSWVNASTGSSGDITGS